MRSASIHMLHRAILWVGCCLLSQSAAWEPRRTSVRFVAGLWLLSSFIVATVYRSNLKAMLILPRTPLPFNSVNELAATDISAYVIKGSLIDHAIKAATPNSPLGRVRNQVVVSSDLPTAILGLYKGQLAAFGGRLGLGTLSAGDFALNGYCSLYIIKEGFLGTSVSLAFPKGSFLISKVNRVISSLSESGILQHLYGAALGNASYCLETISTSTVFDIKLRPLELQDFYGVISVYIGALDNESASFKYLQYFFPKLSEAKVKAGIFI
ncbi:uncharacterized protein LOC135109464 [Scylla paramamosain]|uniref:uncharacterized protein LOC135109464 n=1 Tax=Scylla paramamosain TaxID=85552 RepID=UPI0030835E1A